jgi:hypothetical protein
MTSQTAPARKPFTSVTLDSLDRRISRGVDVGWEEESDLAAELAEVSNLTSEQGRTLIAAIRTGLPVLLTWDTMLNPAEFPRPVERKRTGVILDELSVPAGTPGTVRIAYWGFGHPIGLDQIRAAVVPEPITEFLDAE